jgi:hypothetical protein
MAASKRRLRRLSCEGKTQYATQTEAVAAMISFLKRHPGHHVSTYRCRFGDHWHFGHLPGPRRQ